MQLRLFWPGAYRLGLDRSLKECSRPVWWGLDPWEFQTREKVWRFVWSARSARHLPSSWGWHRACRRGKLFAHPSWKRRASRKRTWRIWSTGCSRIRPWDRIWRCNALNREKRANGSKWSWPTASRNWRCAYVFVGFSCQRSWWTRNHSRTVLLKTGICWRRGSLQLVVVSG